MKFCSNHKVMNVDGLREYPDFLVFVAQAARVIVIERDQRFMPALQVRTCNYVSSGGIYCLCTIGLLVIYSFYIEHTSIKAVYNESHYYYYCCAISKIPQY